MAEQKQTTKSSAQKRNMTEKTPREARKSPRTLTSTSRDSNDNGRTPPISRQLKFQANTLGVGEKIKDYLLEETTDPSLKTGNVPLSSRQDVCCYMNYDPAAKTKRTDYISWDDYFMSVAFLSAMRSKDPATQVGACIVNQKRRIVGIGYNGFPLGCSDDDLPWARSTESGSVLDTKYPFVCHAEMNAILNKNSETLEHCIIYVALFPCNECAKLIIQSGINEVVYLSDKYHDSDSMKASRKMFSMAGVKYRQHKPEAGAILIDFKAIQ